MNTTPSSTKPITPGRQAQAVLPVPDNRNSLALVLAGGGAAGNAWQLGLIAGVAEAGIDLSAADLLIGTSSGSTVAAQISSGISPAELYAAILSEPEHRPSSKLRPEQHRPGQHSAATAQAVQYMDWSAGIIAAAQDAADMRRRMGAAALGRDDSDGSLQLRWRSTVAARLPKQDWPLQAVLITAVNAQTGEPEVFDRNSGVELVDAVAASTSNGFGGSYRIGAKRYINGGYRRNENADLAAGHRRVLILSPFAGKSRTPSEWRMDLASQVEELLASGSRVQTVFPAVGAGDVFNASAADPATRQQAARGGYQQGLGLQQLIAEL
ncbi:patatin-like phospholipase family protein [Psychromicrobium lacuslunae]|uniref:Patatin n=1 Tax=Psychromicrobium lacuslunae TaxID=1618207 RepID=A0A0D4BYD9_9MICC|nr:patatin-like phospholipase family protein [Psychromicrobium lacuslunae]AJT41135.1 patatin [Psychromicrobium lacuslunae]